MEYRSTSHFLQMHITFPIALIVSVISLIIGNHLAAIYHQQFEQQLKAQTQTAAMEVKSFFKSYGQVANAHINNPYIRNWVEQHTERGSIANDSEAYKPISDAFLAVSEQDDNIYSAYFASHKTGEYLRANEITGTQVNYFTYKRPWYIDAIKREGLFVSEPMVDLTTGVASAVIQAPVLNKSKELLGVAGIDLILNSLGKLLENDQDSKNTIGLVVDNNGNLVTNTRNIPNTFKITTEVLTYDGSVSLDTNGKTIFETARPRPNNPIQNFDSHDTTDGFGGWVRRQEQQPGGISEVTFMGEPHLVSHQRVTMAVPELDWTVAYMTSLQPLTKQLQNLIINLILFMVIFITGLYSLVNWLGKRLNFNANR